MATKELYKSYVERILDMNPDDMKKYVSDDRCTVRSKNIQQRWRDLDNLSKLVFKEIAKKHQEKYKEVSCWRKYVRLCVAHVSYILIRRSLCSIHTKHLQSPIQ
jgi:hypothetical protein